MFRKLMLLLIVLVSVTVFEPKPIMRAQEHAPTVDVCRADRALWNDDDQQTDYFEQETKHVNDGARNTNPIAKLPLEEVDLRLMEMGDCMHVDSLNRHNYYEMQRFYASVVSDRFAGFIRRHHLLKQLMDEDAAGKR